MKAILLLLLANISLIGAMESTFEHTLLDNQKAELWHLLPEEIKQHLLSFVPKPGNVKELADLWSISKETYGLVNDHEFAKEFAQRTFKADSIQAKKILRKAVSAGNLLIARAFIKADETLKEYADKLLLHAATRRNGKHPNTATSKKNIEVVKTLLDGGANPNIAFGQVKEVHSRPLWEAVDTENEPMVELLLKNGADPNSGNVAGLSVLGLALGRERLDIAQLLLNHGADPNATKDVQTGRSLLTMIAWLGGRPHIVKLLLNHGADCNMPDYAGHDALYYARAAAKRDPNENINHEVVKLLEAAKKTNESL